MGTCRRIARCSTISTSVLAVVVGLLAAGVPTKLGLYRWIAHLRPATRGLKGLSPAFMLPDEYRYSYGDVKRTDLTGQTAVVTGALPSICGVSGVGLSVICACLSSPIPRSMPNCQNLTPHPVTFGPAYRRQQRSGVLDLPAFGAARRDCDHGVSDPGQMRRGRDAHPL